MLNKKRFPLYVLLIIEELRISTLGITGNCNDAVQLRVNNSLVKNSKTEVLCK